MANPIAKRLRAAIDIVQSAVTPQTATWYGIGEKSKVNNVISDACSSREAEHMTIDLGSSGKLNKNKITLSGKLGKEWGAISRAWQIAVNIDTLAQALEKTGFVAVEAEDDEEVVQNALPSGMALAASPAAPSAQTPSA